MQRYFFNVHDQNGLLLDPEGTACRDREAARETAIVFARSILSEDLTKGFVDLNGRIEIVTASGDVVDVVAFGECVLFIAEGQTRANSRCSA